MILMLTQDLVELLAMLELAGKTRRGKRTRELHTSRADDVLGHHDENQKARTKAMVCHDHCHLSGLKPEASKWFAAALVFFFIRQSSQRVTYDIQISTSSMFVLATTWQQLGNLLATICWNVILALPYTMLSELVPTHLPFQKGSFLGSLSG